MSLLISIEYLEVETSINRNQPVYYCLHKKAILQIQPIQPGCFSAVEQQIYVCVLVTSTSYLQFWPDETSISISEYNTVKFMPLCSQCVEMPFTLQHFAGTDCNPNELNKVMLTLTRGYTKL